MLILALNVLVSFYLYTAFFFNIYFWLCWVFVAEHRLSLEVSSGGLLSGHGVKASQCGALSCGGGQTLGCTGFTSCDARV